MWWIDVMLNIVKRQKQIQFKIVMENNVFWGW